MLVTRFLLSIVVPRVRKPLSADALFHLVRRGFASLPAHRLDDTAISLTAALLSAFAMFSLTAPALLAFDKERAEGHWHTLYGSQRVPCDTYMRERLAPLSPQWLRPVFKSVLRPLQRGQALEPMTFLDDHSLLALAGPEDFASQAIPWAACLPTVHRHGAIPSCHQRLGAASIPPDLRAVIPLMPEPIVRHDGTAKNAWERKAAKRFVPMRRQAPPHLQCIVTADSLSAHAPPIEPLHEQGLHSILGVKAGDHA